MFGIGTPELLIVAVIAVILFGSRLPQAVRGLGRGIKEFRDGVNGIEREVEEAAR